MQQAKCIKGFSVEKYDDDGFLIEDEDFVVEENEIWNIESNTHRLIGGNIRLTNEDDNWLEIPDEMFKEYFKILI